MLLNKMEKGINAMKIRPYKESDLPEMIKIWNQVVESGCSFPHVEYFNMETGKQWFASQTYTAVVEEKGTIVALYCFRPNNIGRCGHAANAHYAVEEKWRGKHIGTAIVEDSLLKAKEFGFKIMQFNTVLECNIHARHVYERCGFVQVGTIPNGYLMKDGNYVNMCLYYHKL